MDIFIIKTSEIDNFTEEFLLNFQKKEISNKKTLMTHCLAYAMLDSILREKYSIENREIVFKTAKPSLKNKEKYFSLSHSSERIAIAFSDFDCGIDIEKIKPRDFDAISARMNFKCDNLEGFYHEWTNFEASYKLGKEVLSAYSSPVEDYMLTAVSSNPEEKFELYIS